MEDGGSEEKEEPKPDKEKVEETKKVVIPDERVDMENEIKKEFLTGGKEKATQIKVFLSDCGTKKVAELSDEKLKELYILAK